MSLKLFEGRIPTAIWVVALLTSLYEWAVFISTFRYPGAIGINYNAPGTDWMVFYEAIRCFISGDLATIFDAEHFTALINLHQQHWLTTPLPFRPWVYPPSFLLLLLPFGMTTFLASFAVFQIATASCFAWVTSRYYGMPRIAVVLLLISPAAAVCVTSGQTSFLVAALIMGGLYFADRRPLASGLLFSILTFKPQFFWLVPVALIAACNWKSLFATAIFGLFFVGLSAALFGAGPWIWWIKQSISSLSGADPRWVEYGRLWGNSVYACAMALSLSARFATALQLAAVLGVIIAVFAAYKSTLNSNIKHAILLALTFVAAPHSGSYDGMLLVISAFIWISQCPIRSESLMPWVPALLIWMVPLASPPILTRVGALIPVLILVFLRQIYATCGVLRATDQRES